MYLKRLYAANKWWFAIITLFIIIQLAMDIRQDIMLSPVYHYGMYSEVIEPENEYTVNEIAVNGIILQTKDFSPYQWDKISFPVKLFQNQQSWDSFVWNTEVKRLLKLSDSAKYINAITQQEFNEWYRNYLSIMLHTKIDSVNIKPVTYMFNGTTFIKKPG
ncbi:MAG TPA: hypothetical protein VG738_07020 [Chitinophagaceae bacterium]|nr:hypothetical protein [Chitinophagaceae bacterium]